MNIIFQATRRKPTVEPTSTAVATARNPLSALRRDDFFGTFQVIGKLLYAKREDHTRVGAAASAAGSLSSSSGEFIFYVRAIIQLNTSLI